MAYNYQGGYGQSNPYDSQGAPPAYGQQSYGGGYDPGQGYNPGQEYNQTYGQQHDVEMQPLTGGGAPYSQSATPQPQDSQAINNDCRTVGRAVDDLQNRLVKLGELQKRFVSGNDREVNREIDTLSADIMSGYRGLADRVKRIKGLPAASQPNNKPQVDALDRRIKRAINAYQLQEKDFRHRVHEQQTRQYQIAHPEASEAEAEEATKDGGDLQIFQQAIMSSNRQGQAQSTLASVRQRHDAIQQIERTMMELQAMFADLDNIVVEQEPLVQNVEQKAEETHTHLVAGNEHVGKAVTSARAARKKKWICLGICVALVIIIIIIVVAYLAATGKIGGSSN